MIGLAHHIALYQCIETIITTSIGSYDHKYTNKYIKICNNIYKPFSVVTCPPRRRPFDELEHPAEEYGVTELEQRVHRLSSPTVHPPERQRETEGERGRVEEGEREGERRRRRGEKGARGRREKEIWKVRSHIE